ncbi:MAG: GAF domain-containing protein [Myxococcales bacterium]|nr:GAF domain-containing protein [Myxococcales bacterium]
MKHLTALDRALVLILVPIWLVWFGFGVRTQVNGSGMAVIGTALESPDGYPVVTGEYSVLYSWDPLEQAGLRAGDRLIAAGDVDLRGAVHREWMVQAVEQQEGDLHVALTYERDGERRETRMTLLSGRLLLPWLAGSFAFALSGLFVLLRSKPSGTVRLYFRAAMTVGLTGCLVGDTRWGVYGTLLVLFVPAIFGFPLFIRMAFLFPDDRESGRRWNRIWPWIFASGGFFNLLAYYYGRFAIADVGIALNAVAASAALIVVATRKYQRTDAIGRRQMRWVVVGAWVAVLPILVGTAAAALDPRFGSWLTLSYFGVPLFPVFLLISVLSYNLFDVDRLLSAAASYNALGILFVGGGLVLIPRVATAASAFLPIDPATGQTALSLLLAALVVPANRRLRPQIERLFFAERYAFDEGVTDLVRDLAEREDSDSVTRMVGERLTALLRPESCVIYAVGERGYVSVFEEGAVVPPAFAADSLLVKTLRERRETLALDDAGRRADATALTPFDRAALETLGAAVVVPVLRGDQLLAFLCLGPKRSGDVYTSSDLSQLATVANAVSHELLRFDQEDLARQSQAMQESLRRYVPGAVADQLASGEELASGEREISVLFVDIRGYTGFSEAREAEAVFSTVNRYTETVSRIVRAHGGSVVEFNGDGMMAVFGAPQELAHKERAAIEAGREIVTAVAALDVDDVGDGRTTLTVGVGIATGEDFVGNIQAADRMIWTAIGNTTNLAARLQGLTRDLEAALVVDGVTFARAQAAAEGFEPRPGVAIRGRRDAQDVYALPLAAGR